jgi:quinol monooxygenase YgiN
VAEAIVYIDQSRIRPGKVGEVKQAVTGLVAFVRANEPQLISYAFYVDEANSSMSVVAVHPDSASLELHMRIGGPEFRKMAAFIELQSIEVYGTPSQAVVDQLHAKARMLGENARVVVHHAHAGFAR